MATLQGWYYDYFSYELGTTKSDDVPIMMWSICAKVYLTFPL
jgi:hypothetical protein